VAFAAVTNDELKALLRQAVERLLTAFLGTGVLQ
jgi:hypothetical protein